MVLHLTLGGLRQVLVATLDLVGQRVLAPLSAPTVSQLLAVIGNVLAQQAAQISSITVGSVSVRPPRTRVCSPLGLRCGGRAGVLCACHRAGNYGHPWLKVPSQLI